MPYLRIAAWMPLALGRIYAAKSLGEGLLSFAEQHDEATADCEGFVDESVVSLTACKRLLDLELSLSSSLCEASAGGRDFALAATYG